MGFVVGVWIQIFLLIFMNANHTTQAITLSTIQYPQFLVFPLPIPPPIPKLFLFTPLQFIKPPYIVQSSPFPPLPSQVAQADAVDQFAFSYLLWSLRHYIYLNSIQMHHEQKWTRSKIDSTEQSVSSNVWSQQHQVYYYSKFDLFDHSQQEFYQFSIFLERVSTELGKEWKKEANYLYSPFFTSREVFMTLMELWLSHHPPVNSHRCLNTTQTTFNSQYLAEFKSKMRQEHVIKSKEAFTEPSNTSVKAVSLGFFMTANEIWEDMFQNESNNTKVDLFSSNIFLKSVTNSLEKTFRPLMVVTQKIGSVFGRKKRKFNEEVNVQESTQSKFQNCYHQFKKTLDMEKQIERKMSDLILDENQEQEKAKIIEKKEFKESESPIQSTLLGSLYSYVNDFLHRNPSWQVASNFVTQILDLNQVKMEEGKKVKVMRPAQDFYRKLVMVWLMVQQNVEESITFPAYLNRLKSTFFTEGWQEKYIVPTKYFFERMKQDWQYIKQEAPSLQDQKEIMNSFIRRIKKSMQSEWDHKIQMRREKQRREMSQE